MEAHRDVVRLLAVERQRRNLAARLAAHLAALVQIPMALQGVKDIFESMANCRWDALRWEMPVASELPVSAPCQGEQFLVTLVRPLPARRPALLQSEVSPRQLALCRAFQQARAEEQHPDVPNQQVCC
ncbi:MAG: hypothetical protein ACRD4S_08860 [Candidatus Acidiferrales bacterium]